MNHKGRRLLRSFLLVLVVIVVAAAVFFGLFYVTDVEVVGNTRYSAGQISEMTLTGPVSYNSVLMSMLNKTVYPDAAFVESVQVKYLGRNRLRLEVQEKYPIGYLDVDGTNYYFDKDGLVLEAIKEQELKAAQKEQARAAAAQEQASVSSASENPQNQTQMQDGQAAGEETGTVEKASHNSSDTVFRPALTDVPKIEGLNASNIQVGGILKVKDPSVFQTILSLTKLIDKFGIQPDYVEFAADHTMTLHYENVRIQIGSDTLLEEKVSRVAAILPELEGLSGVLHLEDYAKDTQNIIFDRDKQNASSEDRKEGEENESSEAGAENQENEGSEDYQESAESEEGTENN